MRQNRKKEKGIPGFKGQSLIEYALLVAVISLVVIFAGPPLSNEITQEFGKIVDALGGASHPGGSQTTDPSIQPDKPAGGAGGSGGQPEPEKPLTAFAVFSADDGSLNFYKRSEVPQAGSMFEGKAATEVYTGIEVDQYSQDRLPAWNTKAKSITKSTVIDLVRPISTAFWFYNCPLLTAFDTSGLDTSTATDMTCMFSGCRSLASLDVSKWDTSKVTNMRDIFGGCRSLASLDVSKWDTSKVTNMRDIFRGCTSLASLDVSKWDTSSATDMMSIFDGCTSLASLDVSKWDTSKVTRMTCMFSGCRSLASLDLSKWDTSKVTLMLSMFADCTSLASLDVSKWDTSSVRMTSMFYNCPILMKVVFGDKVFLNLPVPTADNIPGADGKWYNSKGVGFAPEAIPSNVADTYYASKNLVPK